MSGNAQHGQPQKRPGLPFLVPTEEPVAQISVFSAMEGGASLDAQREACEACRTQLGKLFRISWLSPRIVESIIDGRQPARLDCRLLLEADLPQCWTDQKPMLGFAI